MELSEKEKQARKIVCLPLDNISKLSEARRRVEELSPVVGLFKVGKGSFTRFGHSILEMVKRDGSDVFLDLKYNDIPNTVEDAANAAAELGVYMFNVHASGGIEMLKAAVKGANEGAIKYGTSVPKVIGVTVLTSIDQKILNDQLRVPGSVEDQVLNLAKLSQRGGLDGIVCSAADLYAIRDQFSRDFIYVTPGIKGPRTPAGADQKRVFTPGNAVQDGSTILVIGRAITRPETPEGRLQAGYEVLQDIAKYL